MERAARGSAREHRRPPSGPVPRLPDGARRTPVDRVVDLQRTAGNRATTALIQRCPELGRPNCGCRHPPRPPVPYQRSGLGRSTAQRHADSSSHAAAPEHRIPRTGDVPEISGSTGSPLAPDLRSDAEAAFMADFGAVRVHTGQYAAHAAARLHARAFTVDNDLYFGAGWARLHGPAGLQLLGHELAHVVQQRHGLAEADLHGVGDRYEREADAAGQSFARGEPVRIATAGGSHRGIQRSEDPGADAAQVAVEESPYDLPFIGEANTPAELMALMALISADAGGQPLALVPEAFAMSPGPTTPASELVASAETGPAASEPAQASSLGKPLQLSIVANCVVPGVPPNVIGIAAHGQIGASCMAGAPGCRSSVNIPGDGQADLVRNRMPFVTEIGEIKPASWLGRQLVPAAALQLAGYLLSYGLAYPGSNPIPMWSFIAPPAPFILNPSQLLTVWGPAAGLYFYSCRSGQRRRVRVPVRVPIPVPVPVPVPGPVPVPVPVPVPTPAPAPTPGPAGPPPSPGVTPGQVAKGAVAVGAGIGIGYLIYRGVRMIPSLFPPLWPTIPVNLAVP